MNIETALEIYRSGKRPTDKIAIMDMMIVIFTALRDFYAELLYTQDPDRIKEIEDELELYNAMFEFISTPNFF
jgi:hypothetical protein